MKWLAVGVLVLALGVVAWWRFGRDETGGRKPAKPVASPGGDPPDPPPDSPHSSGAPAAPDKAKVKAAHQLLVQQIDQARQRRLAALAREGAAGGAAVPSVPSLPSMDEPPSPLDTPLAKDYIKERMMDIRPLIQECYETSMATHPELAAGGTITLSFRMAGEPGVGGVILGNKIIPEKSTLAAAPYLAECVTESIYAMRFDPPGAGGFIDVTYPFIFQTAEPDGGT